MDKQTLDAIASVLKSRDYKAHCCSRLTTLLHHLVLLFMHNGSARGRGLEELA